MQRVMSGLAMLLSVAVLALMAVDLRKFIFEKNIAPFTVDSPLAFIIFVMSLLTVFIVINGIQDRIRPFALVSMAGLALTGLLLGKSSKSFTGLMDFGTPYMTSLSIKHILLVVMVVLALVRLSINKRVKVEKKPELQKTSAAILALNALLSVVVLFLSSMI